MKIEDRLDAPRASDFLKPYFYFSSDINDVIRSVSESVVDILEYPERLFLGRSWLEFIKQGSPANEDLDECQLITRVPGESTFSIRSFRTGSGKELLVTMRTSGVGVHDADASADQLSQFRRHHIAKDVTEDLYSHRELFHRWRLLNAYASQFSDQERLVARSVLAGKMNREIARDLNVSERTIDRRRASMMAQMHVKSSADLVTRLVERDVLGKWTQELESSEWLEARNAPRVMELESINGNSSD